MKRILLLSLFVSVIAISMSAQSLCITVYDKQTSPLIVASYGQEPVLSVRGGTVSTLYPDFALVANDTGRIWIIHKNKAVYYEVDSLLLSSKKYKDLRNFKLKRSGEKVLVVAQAWSKKDFYDFWNRQKFRGDYVSWTLDQETLNLNE